MFQKDIFKKTGHLARDCRAARTTCFKCGQQGHISTSCPRRNVAQGTSLNLLQQSGDPEVRRQPVEEASVNGVAGVERMGQACGATVWM